MLSKLYKYATIAYVGGGFGNDGVHNVLEAAVFYKPVILGYEYEKYIEAIELLEAEGAWSIDSTIDLESKMNELLTNTELYKKPAIVQAIMYNQNRELRKSD
jgi:3-deoxy-D-manno-octulosonic-acid transferase